MAIQMRRGLRKDFDPNKMLPGEWAVSIDSVTSNQIVWMCFVAGVCKRMGTYEDFQAQIAEATKDIRDSYVEDFDEIKSDIELIADVVSSDKNEVLIIKSDIVNTYLPQIQALVEKAETAELSAEIYAINSSNSAMLSESYAVGGTGTRNGEDADNAKYYADEARKSAENAAEIVGGDFLTKTGDASNTTVVFEQSTDRTNIKHGESLRTLFGKIMKWLADLTSPAFSQVISSYTDLMSNTVDGYLADGLAIKDGFNELSTKAVNLYNGTVSDWALSNYLTIDVTSEIQAQIDKGFPQVIRFQFGSGSQSIGVAAGQASAITTVNGIDTWVGACQIIEGKTAFFVKQDNKIYIWCDENPSLALRNVLLMKNV